MLPLGTVSPEFGNSIFALPPVSLQTPQRQRHNPQIPQERARDATRSPPHAEPLRLDQVWSIQTTYRTPHPNHTARQVNLYDRHPSYPMCPIKSIENMRAPIMNGHHSVLSNYFPNSHGLLVQSLLPCPQQLLFIKVCSWMRQKSFLADNFHHAVPLSDSSALEIHNGKPQTSKHPSLSDWL